MPNRSALTRDKANGGFRVDRRGLPTTRGGAERTWTPGELLERSLANSAGVVAGEVDDQGDPAIMKQRSRNQCDCRQVSHRVRRSEWFMARRVSRRAKVGRVIRRTGAYALPDFVPPQL